MRSEIIQVMDTRNGSFFDEDLRVAAVLNIYNETKDNKDAQDICDAAELLLRNWLLTDEEADEWIEKRNS